MKRIDEIGQLSSSFGNMQRSLVSYIDELKQTTAQKASIESELKVASDIQMSMVPRVFPPFPERKDIDLHASMTPAKEVGGDLYNFLLLDERLYICLGDVSGKGVPASLFMAQSTRLFRTLAGEGFSPEAIANRMNNALCEGNDTMMFVTMFIGMVDLQTGRLDYCNCGHNPPVLDGQFVELKYKNCPLGMFEGAPFQGECIPDIRGKQFLVYTDGLNEAMNPEKEQFGNDHLLALMATSTNMTSCQVIDMLKEAVEQHRNGAAPNDDLTLLCLSLATSKS
jgi:sigma-B regulation protein RsbU (phosphoserine phosphatase)